MAWRDGDAMPPLGGEVVEAGACYYSRYCDCNKWQRQPVALFDSLVRDDIPQWDSHLNHSPKRSLDNCCSQPTESGVTSRY